MQEVEQTQGLQRSAATGTRLPVSVIIPVRNEAKNLPRCLRTLGDAGEVVGVDSQSTDATVEIAREFGAQVVQFHCQGGWPKKRQWAMDTLPLVYEWILLLDADEVLTPELTSEIRRAIQSTEIKGYYIALRMYFLGRVLRHGDARFWKLSLFRRGKGKYECRLKDQDASMADMEVHEHVYVDGRTARLQRPLIHHNIESLSRYIQKHDEYPNWEARVLSQGTAGSGISASFFGTQAQLRRWLKQMLFWYSGFAGAFVSLPLCVPALVFWTAFRA
jgi:glycosyltransferase involved in cell wall biosynthesis